VTTGYLKGTLGTQLGDLGGARGLHGSRQGPPKVPQRFLSSFLSGSELLVHSHHVMNSNGGRKVHSYLLMHFAESPSRIIYAYLMV
jgi:hypothetical protein